MGLERRILLPTAFLTLGAISCGGPTEPPRCQPPRYLEAGECRLPPPENQAPDTEITRVFGDEGGINYTFSGTDDGSIDHISVSVNGGASQNLSNGSSKLVGIIKGTNRVKATAYDNKGLADPTPAEYSFDSPTEDQANTIISEYLTAHGSSYSKFERDVLISLGTGDTFYVDFLITRNNSTDAVVHYVGAGEHIGIPLENQGMLTRFGVPSLYLFGFPESEIKSRLDIFRNNGFN